MMVNPVQLSRGSVPHLCEQANETFGSGNRGGGLFDRLPARRGPGMSKAADSLRSAISCTLLSAALLTGAAQALAAGGCPTSADAIATDRPDVTNSSLVVPYGSLQA